VGSMNHIYRPRGKSFRKNVPVFLLPDYSWHELTSDELELIKRMIKAGQSIDVDVNMMMSQDKNSHYRHLMGGYFKRGCDSCAEFIGHAVMKGKLKIVGMDE